MRNCPRCRKFLTVTGSYVSRPNQGSQWVYSCWGCGGKYQADGAPVKSDAIWFNGDIRATGGGGRKAPSPFDILKMANREPEPKPYSRPKEEYWVTKPMIIRKRKIEAPPAPEKKAPQYIYAGYIVSQSTKAQKKRRRVAVEIASQSSHSMDLRGIKPELRHLILQSLSQDTAKKLANMSGKHAGLLAWARPAK